MPNNKNGHYEVRRSPIHGKGLFATRTIRQRSHIGRLEGPRTQRDGIHVLWIIEEDENSYGIRGTNDIRFANHSSQPNAQWDGPDVYALRTIRPDEEILLHYGDDWKDV